MVSYVIPKYEMSTHTYTRDIAISANYYKDLHMFTRLNKVLKTNNMKCNIVIKKATMYMDQI